MEMLGGEVDFSVDGLMRCFGAEFTLAFVNVNGLRAAGALREPIDSNSSFPVIPTFRMFLAALEILRHMCLLSDYRKEEIIRSMNLIYGFGARGNSICGIHLPTVLLT